MSVHCLPDGRWICRFIAGTIKGSPKKTKEYFGRGPEGQAAAIRRNDELGVSSGGSQRIHTPLFDELAGTYFAARLATATASTVDSLKYKISRVLIPHIGSLMAHEIDHDALSRFVAARVAQGVKNRTIRDDITYIKAIMAYSLQQGTISLNKTLGFAMPRNDAARIRPPNKAEFEAILAHAAPHVQRAMQVCYFTGARPGPVEVYRLQWSSCDFFNESITITSAEKGGIETREVPIAPRFLELLRSWLEEDTAVMKEQGKKPRWIIHFNGAPVRSIRTGFEAAMRRAGITRRIRRYDLRHMTASEMIAAGVDIKTISEILGNSPEQCMRAYLHVRSPQKKSAVDKL